jgi:sulfite exporter TauE/SafE
MTLFGLGTIPIMLLLAFSGKMISLQFRGIINKAIPYVACFLAVLFILRGLSLGIPYLSPDLSQKEAKTYHCH